MNTSLKKTLSRLGMISMLMPYAIGNAACKHQEKFPVSNLENRVEININIYMDLSTRTRGSLKEIYNSLKKIKQDTYSVDMVCLINEKPDKSTDKRNLLPNSFVVKHVTKPELGVDEKNYDRARVIGQLDMATGQISVEKDLPRDYQTAEVAAILIGKYIKLSKEKKSAEIITVSDDERFGSHVLEVQK